MLWRSPAFTPLAMVCLTLGIGANAAVFSWIEGILLRPFPLVVDQDRLFAVEGTNRGADRTGMSWPDWRDLQRSSTLVDAFIAEKITGTTLSIGDRAERAPGSIVSANYFDALGVHPILGRAFVPGEDTGRNAHPVTVISYQVWQERFHGDPQILRQDADAQWPAVHDRWCCAGWVLRHVRRLRVPVLGGGIDAAAIQRRRLQAGRSRRTLDRRVRPSEAWCDNRSGAGGAVRRDGTPRERVSRDQSRSGHQAVPALADAVQCCGHDAACARCRARRRDRHPAHCVRERGQPAARARVRAPAGETSVDPLASLRQN